MGRVIESPTIKLRCRRPLRYAVFLSKPLRTRCWCVISVRAHSGRVLQLLGSSGHDKHCQKRPSDLLSWTILIRLGPRYTPKGFPDCWELGQDFEPVPEVVIGLQSVEALQLFPYSFVSSARSLLERHEIHIVWRVSLPPRVVHGTVMQPLCGFA